MAEICSTISRSTEKEKGYPWIGEYKYSSLIVLFTSKKTGVCLYSSADSCHVVGGYKVHYWDEENFHPYYGKVEVCMKV